MIQRGKLKKKYLWSLTMATTLSATHFIRKACLYMLAKYQHFIREKDSGGPSLRLQLISGCVMFLNLKGTYKSGYRKYSR